MTTRRNGRRAERRRMTRADAHLSMRLESPVPETEASQVVTESQNISASGVYCMSSHYLAPLSKVALTIVLPRVPGGRASKELIKCEGIVVRCDQPTRRGERPYQLACMFSGLEDEVRGRIDAFVTWRNLQALRAAARSIPRAATRTTARPAVRSAPRVARPTTRKPKSATPAASVRRTGSAAKKRTVH
ncbi:MAG: PilZ domain-containing protein [Candidatus Eisenbacteria bacterium]